MRFFIYGNSGGIDKVKEELSNPKETFDDIFMSYNTNNGRN